MPPMKRPKLPITKPTVGKPIRPGQATTKPKPIPGFIKPKPVRGGNKPVSILPIATGKPYMQDKNVNKLYKTY